MSNSRRKSRKRIHGNDRGLMFICKDIRRRWLQYGENRTVAYFNATSKIKRHGMKYYECKHCDEVLKREHVDVDHVVPVGPRPRIWKGLGQYAKRMFSLDCQVICKLCHKRKTSEERQKRKS